MKKILGGLLVAVCLLVAIHLSFSRRNYNVILITIDTLRADHVSCYNPNARSTPNIDRIADHGTLFLNAVSLIPITLPAHTSIMTSRRPHEQLLFDNGQFLQLNTPTISEILSKEKYETAAFVSLGVLKRVFGLNRGFETYEDNFLKYHRYYRVASEMNALAIPWIEAHSRKQFFAWIHYSDPHEPYIPADAPPDTELRMKGKVLSRACLAKQEATEVQLEISPGENTFEFVSLANSHQGRSFFDHISIEAPESGLKLRFGKQWNNYQFGIG
jgi:Sulfatase